MRFQPLKSELLGCACACMRPTGGSTRILVVRTKGDLAFVSAHFESLKAALIMGYSHRGRLPYVLGEVKALAACVPQARLFTEDEATLPRLREQAGECRLLHLAPHGVFRGDNPPLLFPPVGRRATAAA